MSDRGDGYMEMLEDAMGDQDFERLLAIRTDITDDRELDDGEREFLVGTATTYAADLSNMAMTPAEQDAQRSFGESTEMQRRALGEDTQPAAGEPSDGPLGS